ncbi:hypothetical protein SESBI_04275 [Sesbania bispinosa]|nr:hypothetical protein SESBI_04275 [Sesbania bispinosa]
MAEPVETEGATKVLKCGRMLSHWSGRLGCSTGEEVAAAVPKRATMLFRGELLEQN